jgi:hypothetical protein
MAILPGRALEIKEIDGQLCLVDGMDDRILFVLKLAYCDVKAEPDDALKCHATFLCGSPD